MIIADGFVARCLDPIFMIFIVAHCFFIVFKMPGFPVGSFIFIAAPSEIWTGPEALARIDGLQL